MIRATQSDSQLYRIGLNRPYANNDIFPLKNDIHKKAYKEATIEIKTNISKDIITGKLTQRKMAAKYGISKVQLEELAKKPLVFFLENEDNKNTRMYKKRPGRSIKIKSKMN